MARQDSPAPVVQPWCNADFYKALAKLRMCTEHHTIMIGAVASVAHHQLAPASQAAAMVIMRAKLE